MKQTFVVLSIVFAIVGMVLLSVFTYQYRQKKDLPETQDTTAEETQTTELDADGLPVGFYEMSREQLLDRAEKTTDEDQKYMYLQQAVRLQKNDNPTDVDGLVAAYKAIYVDAERPNKTRALALFKISQQANGYNRYDVFDQFLSPEEQALSDAKKNYLVNKMIYALYPMSIVYIDIKTHEILQGETVDPVALYEETKKLTDADVAAYTEQIWLYHLIPDIYMHMAVLFSLIDESSEYKYVKSTEILGLYDRAYTLCISSIHISRFNATRDFIQIGKINYLLKLGKLEEAREATDLFFERKPLPMILGFFKDGGLSLGRYQYIEANKEIKERLLQGV